VTADGRRSFVPQTARGQLPALNARPDGPFPLKIRRPMVASASLIPGPAACAANAPKGAATRVRRGLVRARPNSQRWRRPLIQEGSNPQRLRLEPRARRQQAQSPSIARLQRVIHKCGLLPCGGREAASAWPAHSAVRQGQPRGLNPPLCLMGQINEKAPAVRQA
jgi:hypothetical protein